MKFKAFIFFLLFASAAMAQNEKFIPQSLGGAPNVKNFVQGVLKGNLGISLASFPDTLTPNLNNRIKNEDGLIIRVKDTLFLRDTIAKKWVNLSGSGSGSGSSGVDSITQVGSILYVWKAGVSTAHDTKTFFTFTPNYNNKMFLMYIDGVLTDSTASGVKDAYGLGGIRVVDSLGNVYIDGSGISGGFGTDTSYLTNGDSILNIRNTDGDIQSYNFAGGAGGSGSTFNPDTLEAAIALKLNISDTASMLSGYQTAVNSKQPLLISGTNIKTVNGNSLLGSGDVVISAGSSLPTQTGKLNNYLKTDGTNTSWSRLKFMNPAYWELFGDSYTLGQGATAPVSEAYYVLLSNLYNKTYNNRAVTGTGTWMAIKQHLANVNPPANSVSNIAMTSIMIGFNDLNRSGVNAKTIAKITNGLKAVITNHFALSMVSGFTGSGVTRTGTWATYNSITLGGGKYTTAAVTATNGSYINYDFIGDNISIGLQARDGSTSIGATFSVSIDGVSQGSFTTNNQTDAVADATTPTSNRWGQMALNFFNLSDSNHSIVVTNTSSDTLVVDYFSILKKPAFCTPILVSQIPKVTTYSNGSNSLTDIANNSIDSLIALYPDYPIVVSKTNKYLNSYNVDGVHPSTKGHRQIFKATSDALDSLLNFNQQQIILPLGNSKILGGLQVQGTISGTNPTAPSGAGVEITYNGITGTVAAYSRTSSTSIDLALNGLSTNFNSAMKLFSTNNFSIGTGLSDVASSHFTVNNNTFGLPQGTLPAARMTTNKRDSITSSILSTTRTSAGSGYTPGTYTNVTLTCTTCANPLAAGALVATVIVPAGGTMPVLSNISMGTNFTIGDVLGVNPASVGGTGSGAAYTVATLNTGVKGLQVTDTSQSNLSVYNGINWSGLISTSLSTISILHGTDYVFTGSTSTFTMPVANASIVGRQNAIEIINKGSGSITLNSGTGSQLYTTSAQSSITIIAGASARLLPTGTDFKVVYNQ